MDQHIRNGTVPGGDHVGKAILEEIRKLREDLARRGDGPPAPRLVTLDQLAAVCGRRKGSLRRHAGQIPGRRARGGRGMPALWDWATARVWLERRFGLSLPVEFPGMGENVTP